MRRYRKSARMALGVCAIAAVALAAACSSSSGAPSGKKTYTIAITVNELNSPYPAAVIAKAKELCAQDGLKCDILDPELNATTQASQIQTAITQGVNAVLYWPADINTERPILEKLKAAHIPVINWGSRVLPADQSLVVTYAGESSTFEGSAMGKQICTDTNGKPTEVGIVAGLPGSDATAERTSGFTDAIKTCPNVQVVANQPANFDQAKALSVAQDMLQSHPKLGAIFAEDDYMGLGVIQAAKNAHKLGSLLIYGVGGEQQFIPNISLGNAQATVQQDPWSYADMGIQAVQDVLAGKQVPNFMPIAMPTITKADASQYTYHW